MINIAVEGESDRELAKAVARAAGRTPNTVRSAGGKTRLDPLIPKYALASRQAPWFILRDSDGMCPVELRDKLSPDENPPENRFVLRIAPSMAEAWLLADRSGFGRYFGVSPGRIPRDPETLPHAKRTVLDLVAQSRSRSVREDMVTNTGQVGPLYVFRINDFARSHWNVEAAAENAPALRRALARLRELDD